VAARARRVVWAESAQRALDEVVAYIWADSPSNAVRVLDRALEAAGSLSTLASRGRIVREVNDPSLRELLVYDFVIEARHAGAPWEVIVEPDQPRQLLVVITAYPVT
jgi:plasmid stabilization system protein ParE